MRANGFLSFTSISIMIVAAIAGVAHAGDAGRAKRDLTFAKDNAETQRWDDFETNMKKAAADMQGLSDAEKAPLLTEIAAIKDVVTTSVQDEVTKRLDKAAKADPGMAKLDTDRAAMRLSSDEAKNYADPAAMEKLRARLATMTGGAAPAPTPPPTTDTPKPNLNAPLTGDLAAAASRIRLAHNMLDQGDIAIASSMIGQAIKLMENVPEKDKTPLLEDLASLSKQIDEADLKAQRAEEHRRIDEQVHRYVGTAESSIQDGIVCDPEWIDKSEALLATSDATTYMSPDELKQYQDRLTRVRSKLQIHNKEVALQRSAPILKELEEAVAADPFKGVDDQSAYKVFSSLKTLSDRVRAEFYRVPKDDPEIKAVLDRVAAANAKSEASAGKWAAQKMHEQLAANWKMESDHFAGWEAEQLTPDSAANRRVEGLTKTTQAVSGTVYWLNSTDTKSISEKYKDDAVVVATLAAAHTTLDMASAKLNEAFNAVLAKAESDPMPSREADRAALPNLAREAGLWFEGTQYKQANVARAVALDTKWKADVDRLQKEMADNLNKLTAEANAAWPKIEAAAGAERGFDPADARQWKGKTIEIKGRYNRSGWDFDGAYNFATTIKGIPIAGTYEPNVLAAFEEGSRHTQFGIDDHVGWDIIAIVQGPGKINRRVNTDWKDKDTHEVILKTETYVPEPCVFIKIIALRAGPVAVGPK